MNLAVLRAEGTDAALQQIIEQLALDCNSYWRKGEIRRKNQGHLSSGFNCSIAEADKASQLKNTIKTFLVQCQQQLVNFCSVGVSAVIDISLASTEQFSASISFVPQELAMFADCGLQLCVSAYPAADEDD